MKKAKKLYGNDAATKRELAELMTENITTQLHELRHQADRYGVDFYAALDVAYQRYAVDKKAETRKSR